MKCRNCRSAMRFNEPTDPLEHEGWACPMCGYQPEPKCEWCLDKGEGCANCNDAIWERQQAVARKDYMAKRNGLLWDTNPHE